MKVIIANSWEQYNPLEEHDIKEVDGEIRIDPTEALGNDRVFGGHKAALLSEFTLEEFKELQKRGKIVLLIEGLGRCINFTIEETGDLAIIKPDWKNPED